MATDVGRELNIKGVGMTSQRTRTRLVERLRRQGVTCERVLSVVGSTPRHAFVDEALSHRAYEDISLPIGYNQTISQPLVVAQMTEALLTGDDLGRVLEVGTGSGYQTAILAQLAKQVYTIERVAGLQRQAKQRLASVGYRNVKFRHGDGNLGWPEHAPFDAIIVTAAPQDVPPALIEQLAEGARLLAPVGNRHKQELTLMEKTGDAVQRTSLGPVRFVPLLGGKS